MMTRKIDVETLSISCYALPLTYKRAGYADQWLKSSKSRKSVGSRQCYTTHRSWGQKLLLIEWSCVSHTSNTSSSSSGSSSGSSSAVWGLSTTTCIPANPATEISTICRLTRYNRLKYILTFQPWTSSLSSGCKQNICPRKEISYRKCHFAMARIYLSS